MGPGRLWQYYAVQQYSALIRFVPAACGAVRSINENYMDVMVVDLIDAVQEKPQEDGRNAKKPMQ